MESYVDDSYSSDDKTNNANSFVALSRFAQLLFQNNACSSNIDMRRSIIRDRIEAEQLLIQHYFAGNPTFQNELFC